MPKAIPHRLMRKWRSLVPFHHRRRLGPRACNARPPARIAFGGGARPDPGVVGPTLNQVDRNRRPGRKFAFVVRGNLLRGRTI